MKHRNRTTLAAIAFLTSLTASSAQAQGLTFGGSVAGESVRTDRPERARKAQARHCRLERHQVYDTQGRLSWRTIQVCG
jgi:hypothetical protein